jgi:hypothetical protein
LYQFYEQMSKHLWSSDDYEYIVATAGLAYMKDSSCSQVGNKNGRTIYAGVQPMPNANIAMGLYSDSQCTQLLNPVRKKHFKWGKRFNEKISYSDFYYGDNNGGSQSSWWTDTQEPTMTLFNQVFSQYQKCTLCIDYPSYQDGSLLGNYGTDDSVMINQVRGLTYLTTSYIYFHMLAQPVYLFFPPRSITVTFVSVLKCWKFYSHYSYTCNGDCLSMASTQGTILQIKYRGKVFGSGTPYGEKGSSLSNSSYSLNSRKSSTRSHGNTILKLFISFVAIYFIGKYLLYKLKVLRNRDIPLIESESES